MNRSKIILDEKKVNQYIFSKHNVLPGFQNDDIVSVARNNLGIHSARLHTPYTTLCSRSKSFVPNELKEKMYKSNELIKLRCMRTTLHTVSLDIAPIVHMSTLKMRLSKCYLYYKKNNISKRKIDKLKYSIMNLIDKNKMSSKEIESALLEKNCSKELIRIVIKDLWENGDICYFNNAFEWEKEERYYCPTKIKYPKLNLNSLSELNAQIMLISLHIKQYGPVTMKDILWWSGLNTSIVKDVLEKLSAEIVQVKISGSESVYYMNKYDYENYMDFDGVENGWLSLLAYEDSSLKGYYESRYRYVEHKNYNSLFNQIGEVRASVLLDGKAVGVWEWNKRRKMINWSLFDRVKKEDIKKIQSLVSDYEYRLNDEYQQLKIF
jgi:hypothetical protein